MARPAPIRLAGMIAATATFALLATEASAQETPLCDPETGATCSSTQTQSGDVIGTVNLNVSIDQLEVTNDARGNSLAGGIEDSSGSLTSRQTMTGATRANTSLVLNGESDGVIVSTTDARGNYLGVSTDGATFTVDATQIVTGERVEATTDIDAPAAHVLDGMAGGSLAVANSVAMGGPSSSITGVIDQSAQTTVFAETAADVQYIPAQADFSSQAVANAVQVSTTGASHQDLTVRQTNAPSTVEARTDVYVDNAWNLAARANAGANQTVLYNAGGSMVANTNQTNQGRVRAVAQAQTNLQGQTTVSARAVANEVVAGNNDIYLELDNTQLNSGGVEASAVSIGVDGYDTYVGAEAVGNSVTGYACSQCGGEINITNTQTNDGNVSATATTTIGSGRAAVVGVTAVGNSATFYVSRPGG
ncbi:holdfast anchor protein HfaD [Brevundimonas sp.]|uniref:holdfast anchor protein HfaD n=1 Tax=Brevundimonas sp. TaxID=1871086 RepID=UPI0025C0AA9A|nr:holdfast anchor protein HfaD [Brevundimonas sp.]